MSSLGDLFIGRRSELAELTAALADAAAGNGRLVLISGEAGIGKTRLAEQLARQAEAEQMNVLWGRCWEGDGGPAFWAWRQCLRSYVTQSEPGAVARQASGTMAILAQLVPEIREKLSDLVAPSPVADPDEARSRLFDATVSFAREASSSRPLLIIFDDLHWADRPTLLLVRFLARNLPDSRILVCGAYRDTDPRAATAVDEALADLARETRRLTLGGLSPEELAEFIRQAGGEGVSDALVSRIHAATEGNPFFVAELVRLLASEGPVTKWEGSFDLELPMPTAVRTAVRRHLASLSPEARRILAVGAVIGREFELSQVERVLGPEEPILEPAGEAVRAGTVTRVSPTLDRHRFVHTLVRETLYADLPLGERSSLHQKVAAAIEAVALGKAVPLANLAHHYFEAALLGELDKAVGYARRAADEAMEMLAYEEAVRQLERALSLAARRNVPDASERFDLLLRLGHALWGFNPVRSKDVFLEAARLAEHLGDPQRFARAIIGIGGRTAATTSGAGDLEFVALLERAYAALGEEQSALRASVAINLASALHFTTPETDEKARALAEQGLRMARTASDERGLLEALIKNTWATSAPDTVPESLESAREIVELAGKLGDDLSRHFGHMVAFARLLEICRVDDAFREADRAGGTKRRDSVARVVQLTIAGTRAGVEGDFGQAEEIALRIRAFAEETRNSIAWQLFFDQLVHVRWIQGRLEEMLEEARSFADKLPALPNFRCYHLWICAEVGRDREARRLLAGLARNGFADKPRDHTWVGSLCLVAEAVARLGDAAAAERLCDILGPYGDRIAMMFSYSCFGPVARYLALLEACRCRLDDAERHFETALDNSRLIRSRPWTAHTQHDYARMLRARGGPGDEARARALAAEALATARRRGMKALQKQLCAMGEHPSDADVFQLEGDVWTIAFAGAMSRLRDAKGLRYLAALLGQPGVEVHAADVAGIGGGAGARAADAERARLMVTQRIKAAIGKIGEANPPLASHLRRTIRTGRVCCYEPDVRGVWRL